MPHFCSVSWFLMGYALHSALGASTQTDCPSPFRELSQSYSINCSITGLITAGITWTRPDNVQIAICNLAHSCLPIAGYTVPVATATLYTLTISSLKPPDHGVWQCVDGAGILVPTCDLDQIYSPGTCKATKSVSDSTARVDLIEYYCSANATSFELREESGSSTCPLVLANPSATGVINDTGTCQDISGMTGRVTPYLLCGSNEIKLNCSILIAPDTTDMTTSSTPVISTIPPPTDCRPCIIVAAIAIALVLILVIIGTGRLAYLGNKWKKKKDELENEMKDKVKNLKNAIKEMDEKEKAAKEKEIKKKMEEIKMDIKEELKKYKANFQRELLAWGLVWLLLGLLWIIIVFAVCSQVCPPEVLPCGAVPIIGVVLSIIGFLAGLVLIILRCTKFADEKKNADEKKKNGNGKIGHRSQGSKLDTPTTSSDIELK